MWRGKKAASAWLLLGMGACNQIGGIQDGTLRECFTVDDCRVGVPECRAAKACQGTRCMFEDAPEGTPIEEQTTGDCAEIVCDGAGKLKRAPLPADVADDGDPCTVDQCLSTTPTHTKKTELPCYTGAIDTRQTGICSDGMQRCDDAGNPIGGCEGEILPRTETCLYSDDEDCDGESNEEGEACVCKPGEITFCYTGPAATEGIGICHAGTQTCNPDGLGKSPCTGEQTPQAEVCDALMLDEDCDGQSEQGDVCYCGDGIISTGENCDDSNGSDGDDCPSDCHLAIVGLAAGEGYNCVAFDDARLKCWGANDFGQLGLEDMQVRGDEPDEMGDHLPPVDLGTGEGVKAIAAALRHVCAILTGDRIKCWGDNTHGQLGLGDIQARGQQPNEMGDHLFALDLGSGRTVVANALGETHSCAILNDGGVKCWGNNVVGQLGLGDTDDRGDGPNEMGDVLPVVNLGTDKTAKAIASGRGHTCVILNDDNIKCWGVNSFGELGLGSIDVWGDQPNEMGDALPIVNVGTGKTAKAIALGGQHTCAILSNGSLKCWGENYFGQLGLGSMNARGGGPNEMGDSLPAVDLGIGKTVKIISAGYHHTCAVLNDNNIKCWGANVYGQLGLGDLNARGDGPNEMGDKLPTVNLGAGKTATAIATGPFHTCAVLNDGSLKCWGENHLGTLGLGDALNRGDDPNEMGDNLFAAELW